MNKKTLIHNVNSNLSSIKQALPIVSKNIKADPEQAEKIISLCLESFEKLLQSWEDLKKHDLS